MADEFGGLFEVTYNGQTYTINTRGITSQRSVTPQNNTTAQNVAASSNNRNPAYSTSTTNQIIDAICEGPIEGWPTSNILKHVYLDGTPVQSYNNTINTSNLKLEATTGTADQAPLSQYSIIGAVKSPSYTDELYDIDDSTKGTPTDLKVVQQVQIRDDTDGAYPPVEAIAFTFNFPEGLYRFKSSGGRDPTPVMINIEINNKSDGTGTWVKVVEDPQIKEITSGSFDLTYVIEIPPGWTSPLALQEYGETNKVDDVIQFRIFKSNSDYDNDRAHSKVYIKSYSVYTKNQYSFPYTALVGITVDSKNFDSSVPRRQYDLKLLKVKVPSNYSTTIDADTGKVTERKYTGTWNGTFKEELEWTDNPVWCFYDLVTNERYGLGKYISSDLLNKWKLYEIAKYCDAVEQVGSDYIFSIPEGKGGVPAAARSSLIKEPRFTCNILIKDREEAYSVIQRMASLFRGIAYFQHGGIQLIQDKPTTPVFLYNNTNVIDGSFTYSSSSAKARHTVAIVKWLDPEDLYSEKLEYVEDYDGIARYGYREIEIDGFGCTSRGQARRIGRHILITEKFELETVSFKVGMEGAVVMPGSVIKIKDSFRQLKRAGGRVVQGFAGSIVIDKPIDIPAGATNILLWVETPTALNETIESNTSATYKPTLTSHSITQGAGSTGVTTLVLSSGTFSTIPTAGNIWVLSYIPQNSQENASLFKVLSVNESSSYEYEITALQHYSDKYDAIEAYAPIPEYKPVPFNLFVPPPDEGWISAVPCSTPGLYDLKVSWRSSNYVSGTKYRVLVTRPSKGEEILAETTDTSYVLEKQSSGVYYFKIITVGIGGTTLSEPLLLGPYTLKEILPQNSFNGFSQTAFTSDSITNAWAADKFPNDAISYEVWRNTSNTLRTLTTSKNIRNVDNETNRITLSNFSISGLLSPSLYRLEVPLIPNVKYTAKNVNKFGVVASTSTTLIVLESREKPDVSIGDKLRNTTRDVDTNVVGVTFNKVTSGKYYTQIQVEPPVASQTSGDIIYVFKGVAGVGLTEKARSAAIKLQTFTTQTGTNNTTIVGKTNSFVNVQIGDIVVNTTLSSAGKKNIGRIVTGRTDSTLTVSSITGQLPGQQVAIYQATRRAARSLKKFKLNKVSGKLLKFGDTFDWQAGQQVQLKDFSDSALVPSARETILVNLTRGKAAEIISYEFAEPGLLQVNYWPYISNAAVNDEVIILGKDEVFSASIKAHIHPVADVAAASTTSSVVYSTNGTFFSSTQPGDILVNATRGRSSVIISKQSSSQVSLLASANVGLQPQEIVNQSAGDIIFVLSSASIGSSYTDKNDYIYPTIYTTIATTNATTVTATGAFSGVTTNHILYNATRNNYSAISSVSGAPNSVTLAGVGISGQSAGDKIYTFLPSTVNTTTVTAPDGAFKYARPGDLFWNITRGAVSTIRDVVTLTGITDKKLDKIVLESPIASQTAGDSFLVYQGSYSTTPTAFIENGTHDIVEVPNVMGLSAGDRIFLYKMEATFVGGTNSYSLIDTALEPSTTYYYWMRVASARSPFIVGQWEPSDSSGDPASTLPSTQTGNYNTSNDNNGDPIAPDQVTPIAPFMDLPVGGLNATGLANINIYWEWTGRPAVIDGFVLYFWSSNDLLDDPEIDADEDFIDATTAISIPVNPGIKISNVTWTGTTNLTVTVTTNKRHKLQIGDKVRIVGLRDTTNSLITVLNNSSDLSTDYVTVTGVNAVLKQFTYTKTVGAAPANLFSAANSPDAQVRACKYVYQLNDVTPNFWYNAWVQPYRMVNKTISENGIIVGTPKKIYS